MIDTDKYENMRLLFLDFIDTASDEVDEEAWKDKLTALDELLAEVKRLHSIIDYIRNIGRAERTYRPLLSIMEKVLTTEEYLEWRDEE